MTLADVLAVNGLLNGGTVIDFRGLVLIRNERK